MNIIVVISDTLRQDHLPCYGNDRIIAPRIKTFAEQAIIFDDCHSASFPTVPTRADLMTGKFTFTYLEWGPLPGNEQTLAEYLTRVGFLTCGIADTPFLIRNGYGYDRGFRDFQWIRGQRHGPERIDVESASWLSETDRFAPRTFKAAIEWLERHYEEKFFLYIDTWDPHEPWDPPAHFVKPYYPDYNGELVDPIYWNIKEDSLSEKDLQIAHACYCGEISMVDRWFGMLLDRVESLGLMENTAIIFCSDHGFYFGEHDLFGKRRFRWEGSLSFEDSMRQLRGPKAGYSYRSPIHNELTHVPLLSYIPGVESQRINALISLPDVMPTILELAGVEIPNTVQASSLLPLIRGEVDKLHDIVVASVPLERKGGTTKTVDDNPRQVIEVSPATISDGEWDMLFTVAGEPVKLYRAVEDPGHLHNVAADNGDVIEHLHAQFLAWLEDKGTAEEFLETRRKI